MPKGQFQYSGSMIASEISSAIEENQHAGVTCPPLDIDITDKSIHGEYAIVTSLSVDAHGYDEEENITGRWTLEIALVDLMYGGILKADTFSWYGTISDAIIRVAPGDPDYKPRENPLRDFVRNFLGDPLNKVIYDYECQPNSLTIETEEEEIGLDEEMEIKLSGIHGTCGGSPPEWWTVLVEVDQGEILNAPKHGGLYSVSLEQMTPKLTYKSPDECPEEKKLNITVYNTCKREMRYASDPKDQIASKQIKIKCPEYQLEYKHATTVSLLGDLTYKVNGTIDLTVKGEGEVKTIEGQDELTVQVIGGQGVEVQALLTSILEAQCYIKEQPSCKLKVEIEGDLTEDQVALTLEEIWNYNCSGTLECYSRMGKDEKKWEEPFNPESFDSIKDLEFPNQDGAKITEPWGIGDGNLVWILHKKEE